MSYIMTLKTAATLSGWWTNRFAFSSLVQGVSAVNAVNINESVTKNSVECFQRVKSLF